MGSIDIIKPLSTVLSRAVNKLCKIELFLGMPIIEPWPTGCKARMLSIVLCGPPSSVIISCLTLSDLRLQLVPIKREEDDLELRVQLPKKFVLLQRHVVS